MNNIATHFKNGLDYATFTASRAEPLEKAAKLIYRQIELANLILKNVSAPFLNLSSQLKDACTVFETVKIFGNIKMFIVRERNGNYLLTNPQNSWQKKVDRVTLLCHNTFKFVKGMNKFGFVQLGVMAKEVIGKLPIFNLAMDGFIIASSFFGAWDSIGLGIPSVHKKRDDANQKLEKWETRLAKIELLKAGDPNEGRLFSETYTKKYDGYTNLIDQLTTEVASLEAKIAELSPCQEECQPSKELEAAQAKLSKIRKDLAKAEGDKSALEPRIEMIRNQDWKGLAQDLEAAAKRNVVIVNAGWKENAEDNKISNVDFKIRKYEAAKANAKIDTNKTWLKIANNIGKIAVVALALVLTATNFWVFPTFVAINVVGSTVDSIGLTKILTDEFYKNITEPRAFAI